MPCMVPPLKFLNMSNAHFKILADHPSYVWLCCTCGIPSFRTSLLLSEINTSNRFDVLPDFSHCNTDLSTDSHPAVWSPGSRLHSASPSRNKRRQRKDNECHGIKILNINCQSVSAKKERFLAIIEDENPDVIVGTELWLTPDHYSRVIFPPQYQVFQKDWQSDAHGGVFIATKMDLVAILRDDLSHPNSELLWV